MQVLNCGTIIVNMHGLLVALIANGRTENQPFHKLQTEYPLFCTRFGQYCTVAMGTIESAHGLVCHLNYPIMPHLPE